MKLYITNESTRCFRRNSYQFVYRWHDRQQVRVRQTLLPEVSLVAEPCSLTPQIYHYSEYDHHLWSRWLGSGQISQSGNEEQQDFSINTFCICLHMAFICLYEGKSLI